MKPIFDQGTLAKIHANNAEPELAGFLDDDWHLRLKVDRLDLRMPVGTEIIVRRVDRVQDGKYAVVEISPGEHRLQRAPVTEGVVVGVVVGVVREVPGDA